MKNGTVTLPYGYTQEDAFGPFFALCPSQFKLLSGDRGTIDKIIAFLNKDNSQKKLADSLNKLSLKSTAESEFTNAVVARFINLLQKLLLIANSNLKREKGGFRFNNQTKWIATYLRLICGPLGYESIQRNLEGVLR